MPPPNDVLTGEVPNCAAVGCGPRSADGGSSIPVANCGPALCEGLKFRRRAIRELSIFSWDGSPDGTPALNGAREMGEMMEAPDLPAPVDSTALIDRAGVGIEFSQGVAMGALDGAERDGDIRMRFAAGTCSVALSEPNSPEGIGRFD